MAGASLVAQLVKNPPAMQETRSTGEESTCNAGDPGLIPGLGRSTGEGIGYPPQDSWASLVVQLVKNPLARQETWVRSLGWEDPLEKGRATHSSTLAWRIPTVSVETVGSLYVTCLLGVTKHPSHS